MTLHDEDKHIRIFQEMTGMPREAFVSKICIWAVDFSYYF